jgi:exopolysaccharide production protein ExoZ
MRKLVGVQYLRAVAALGVVIFHAASHYGLSFAIGQAGVDLFFVLSGFLMIAITNNRTRPQSFIADRLRRIVPIYWMVTGIMVAGAAFHLFPNVKLTTWHIVSSLLFIPSISPSNGQVWPLVVPGWTLNLEVFFYTAFAPLLLLRTERVRVAMLALTFICLVVLGLLVRPTSPILRAYTDPMVLEFAAGAALGLIWKEGLLGWAPAWPMILAAIILYGVAFSMNDLHYRALLYGAPALLIFAGTLRFEQTSAVSLYPVPLFLGDASYSIYLWHGLGISVAAKILQHVGLAAPIKMAICILIGTAVGAFAFRCLERPLLRAMKERRIKNSVPVPAGP